MTTDELQQTWREQEVTVPAIALDDLKRGARRFQLGIKIRNFAEYAAAVVVVVGYGNMLMKFEKPWLQIGCSLIIIATLFVVIQIRLRMSGQKMPPHAVGASFVEFHRAAMARQIDGLSRVLYWYLLPFLPGWSMFIVQSVLDREWGGCTFLVGSAIVVGGGIVALNNAAVRKLRRQLDELDRLSFEERGATDGASK